MPLAECCILFTIMLNFVCCVSKRLRLSSMKERCMIYEFLQSSFIVIFRLEYLMWCRYIRYNDTCHNDTERSRFQCDTQYNNASTKCWYAKCNIVKLHFQCYAERCYAKRRCADCRGTYGGCWDKQNKETN
jgi:hypothetical protein